MKILLDLLLQQSGQHDSSRDASTSLPPPSQCPGRGDVPESSSSSRQRRRRGAAGKDDSERYVSGFARSMEVQTADAAHREQGLWAVDTVNPNAWPAAAAYLKQTSFDFCCVQEAKLMAGDVVNTACQVGCFCGPLQRFHGG